MMNDNIGCRPKHRFANSLYALLVYLVHFAYVMSLFPSIATGQVSSNIVIDGSLPGTPSVVVNPDLSGTHTLTEALGHRPGGGTILLYSFGEFSIGTGDSALFNSTLPTAAVISRVTGGNPSNIDGAIRFGTALSGADFFLLNQNGVFFGNNASLSIGGELHVSTAESLIFSNGEVFETSAGGVIPAIAITIAAPPTFGFLGNAGAIIDLDGSQLFNRSGVSLRAGTVNLRNGASINTETFDADDAGTIVIEASGAITLSGERTDTSSSLLNATTRSTGDAGTIELRATNVTIASGARIDARTNAAGDGGQVIVEATETLTIGGTTSSGGQSFVRVGGSGGPTGNSGSIDLLAETIVIRDGATISASQRGSGVGGDISFLGGNIRLQDESSVLANTFSIGSAGKITLQATDSITLSDSLVQGATTGQGDAMGVEMIARSVALEAGSAVSAIVVSSSGVGVPGVGGDIVISSDVLTIVGTSTIDATTLGRGDGGNILLNVDNLLVTGLSEIKAQARGSADGGDVTVNADVVVIAGESEIDVTTTGSGAGGDITLNVGTLTMTGFSKLEALTTFSGQAGDITVNADDVEIAGGSLMAVNVVGSGSGGNVTVNATTRVRLIGTDSCIVESQCHGSSLQAATVSGSTGIGGSITVTSPILEMTDGASITAQSFGFRQGGDITIEASDYVSLSGRAPLPKFETAIKTDTRNGGVAGDISIATPSLEITDGAIVRASTNGTGAGGSIVLDVERLAIRSDGKLIARSVAVDENGDPIPVPFGLGAAGSIQIGVVGGLYETRSIQLDQGEISTFAELGPGIGEPQEGNIAIDMQGRLILDNRSSISASVEVGLGGSIDIRAQQYTLLRGESAITAETELGNGGTIVITSDVLLSSPSSRISADSGLGVNGDVTLNSPVTRIDTDIAPLETSFLDARASLLPTCAARESGESVGRFTIHARRGMRGTPDGYLTAFDGIASHPLKHQFAGSSQSSSTPEVTFAQTSLEQATLAFRGGRFDDAAREFETAAAIYTDNGDSKRQAGALRALAESRQAGGHHYASISPLLKTLAFAEDSRDHDLLASTLGSLGNAYLALGEEKQAEHYLRLGLATATGIEDRAIEARLLTSLGNLRARQRNFETAVENYTRAAELARATTQPDIEARALTSAGRAALELGNLAVVREWLGAAMLVTTSLPIGHERGTIELHLARSYERLALLSARDKNASLLAAHRALSDAIEIAQHTNDQLLLSYGHGQLGGLYLIEDRRVEALYLTRLALREADSANVPESLYRWHRQEAQLLFLQGDANASVAAYRRAIAILEESHQEILSQFGEASLSFRRNVAPVYLELTRVLLASSSHTGDPDLQQQLLREARNVVEQLRGAELREYFRDECIAALEARVVEIDTVSPDTAVIYPIAFPDSLELLVSLPSGLRRYSVPITADALSKTVATFRHSLRNPTTNEYLIPSRSLYDSLIRPYLVALGKEGIETLVFVPGGSLHTIPMAALHDGGSFLSEHFGLAVTPSFRLLDPKALNVGETNVLMAGLSLATHGHAPLPHVRDEFAQIKGIYEGRVLLDSQFNMRRVMDELVDMQPTILHIASHASFSGDRESSYLLTHEGRVTMDTFAAMIRRTRFSDEPLELLVLSACETAAGDERSALGLAGVAIRAGAKSTIGSLWSISDIATMKLISEFYSQLNTGSVSKATALQRAQQALRNNPRFEHPFYWSPYLLIGNWL